MSDAVAKLSRRAWRLSWLTPLAAGTNFKPQTEALIAIRRFVDDMVDGGSSAAIVVDISRRCGRGGPRDRHRRRASSHLAAGRSALAVGPMQPRIFGPYEPIRRDYPIEEYLADLAGCGVVKSVYVQTNWAKERFEDEAAWVQRTARGDRLAARHRRLRRFHRRRCAPAARSARALSAACAASACSCTGTTIRSTASPRAPISATIPTIRATSRVSPTMIWSFDLQVFAPQMADAAGLAEACPDVTFVLQHAGMLEDLSPAGRAAWRAGMARLAACPMSSASSPASAPSCIATTRHISPIIVARDRGDVRRRALPVRLEFSDREAVDQLWRSGRAYLDAATFKRRPARAILRDTAIRVYRLAP